MDVCQYGLEFANSILKMLQHNPLPQLWKALEMLVAQAQAQAEWWTGVKANPIVMEQAAMKALEWRMRDS
jgi:shikimate 5-dehydrogenase